MVHIGSTRWYLLASNVGNYTLHVETFPCPEVPLKLCCFGRLQDESQLLTQILEGGLSGGGD